MLQKQKTKGRGSRLSHVVDMDGKFTKSDIYTYHLTKSGIQTYHLTFDWKLNTKWWRKPNYHLGKKWEHESDGMRHCEIVNPNAMACKVNGVRLET